MLNLSNEGSLTVLLLCNICFLGFLRLNEFKLNVDFLHYWDSV